MIDARLVQRKLSQISKYLDELETVAAKPHEQFVGSLIHYEAERLTELIVGDALDVNYHFIKELGLSAPADYKDSFIALGTAVVLNRSFAREISNSAKLRNLLVHHYDEVDLDRFHAGLKGGIADYRRYVKEIFQYLTRTEDGSLGER